MKRTYTLMLLFFALGTSIARTKDASDPNRCIDAVAREVLITPFNVNHENHAALSFNRRIENPNYRNKVDEDEQKNHSSRATNFSAALWVYGFIGIYIVVMLLFFRLFQQNKNRK